MFYERQHLLVRIDPQLFRARLTTNHEGRNLLKPQHSITTGQLTSRRMEDHNSHSKPQANRTSRRMEDLNNDT
jgi:hypothetical protein